MLQPYYIKEEKPRVKYCIVCSFILPTTNRNSYNRRKIILRLDNITNRQVAT